jgi:predicted ATPase
MLTRLKVSGFKNLVDVDVHFGPFTCIAGANGVGKSNLFDAVRFLSALADNTFLGAAKSVRDESGRTGDIRSLFHRIGNRIADRMRFEVEMIIPKTGTDHLGQKATAKATFLRYTLELGAPSSDPDVPSENLFLIQESLEDIKAADAKSRLGFDFEPVWYKSAIVSTARKSPFISTESQVVRLHQENVQGRTTNRPAGQLPRTVLSATNASESPTALLAKQELQSWRLLQLEPTALRCPDEFSATPRLGVDGSHLPATLYRLSKSNPRAYEIVAGGLKKLIRDIREIRIDRDEKRELLTLLATDQADTPLPAKALSDGTLRFLALAVLDLDPEAVGMICFEEPENGIHPERIPAMLDLLRDIAMDTKKPLGDDNPLRQVIVNTHSPLVVAEVDQADLIGAESGEIIHEGRVVRSVKFKAIEKSWRCQFDPPREPIALGVLVSYLKPPIAEDEADGHHRNGVHPTKMKRRSRVKDLLLQPTHFRQRQIRMKELRITLCTEGTSDEMLLPIINWTVQRHVTTVAINSVHSTGIASPGESKTLEAKFRQALQNYPCDLLVIHLDSEKRGIDYRNQEIQKAISTINQDDNTLPNHVSLIPIRESEAWALIDENAIRRAAQNRNGRVKLNLPVPRKIEEIADPKKLLNELIATASEQSGRRLEKLLRQVRPRDVIDWIENFSPLLELSGFQSFDQQVQAFTKTWEASNSTVVTGK